MLIPIRWFREYVAFDLDVPQLGERLTMAGLEVEEIHETEGDTVLDIYVTPNRGDCLSLVGVAREVAAITGGAWRGPKLELRAEGPPEPDLSVTIEAPDLCPRYAARVIRGVRVGESPEWLQARLRAAGLRPISNVVDVTNFVMLELGQPLHAFDLATLREGRIVVRRARAGETITTIDGTEVALEPEMLVIADAERPVAIAGVMGGLDSEVTDGSTGILLECAAFQPQRVRRGARTLDLGTEASKRYERGVDPAVGAPAFTTRQLGTSRMAGWRGVRGSRPPRGYAAPRRLSRPLARPPLPPSPAQPSAERRQDPVAPRPRRGAGE